MTNAMHLDEGTWRRLLAGELSREEAGALARHLDGDCATCEGFLAARTEADALDGRVDRALAALAPPAAAAGGNDLEFQRILRGVAPAQVQAPRPRHLTPRRLRAVGVALAAGLLVAGVAGLLVRRPEPGPSAWDGEKGARSPAIPVRLRFLVLEDGGARAPAIEKGVSGQTVPRDASLSFEIELGRPAVVALVRVPSQGAPEVVFQAPLAAGRNEVTVDGRPAAYPLGDLSGAQRFAVIAAPDALDAAGAVAAAQAWVERGAPEGPGSPRLSADAVEVIVR